MQTFPPTIILRHTRENLKKCSLTGLESREDLIFFTYPKDRLPLMPNYVMLSVEAPPLTLADAACGLFFIDATWRLAAKMEKVIDATQTIQKRSLPFTVRTAYPRAQTDCPDPERGLATVEAIYLAYQLLGRPVDGLLDHYYWKNRFFSG